MILLGTAVYFRILLCTAMYCHILRVLQGTRGTAWYCRVLHGTSGYWEVPQGTAGTAEYCRILWVTAGYCGVLGILHCVLQGTAGY